MKENLVKQPKFSAFSLSYCRNLLIIMPKLVSLKLKQLRKNGYNNVSEWLQNDKHLYIGREMNISIYTKRKTIEPPGTQVGVNNYGKKILIRPYKMRNVPFETDLLSYPVGSYVDHNGQIIHLCNIPKSKWHNPFKANKYGQHNCNDCVKSFEQYLLSNQSLMNSLHELENYTEIGCWCVPRSCHGDVILTQYHKYKFKNKNKDEKKINEETYIDVWDMLPSSNDNDNDYTNYNSGLKYRNYNRSWRYNKHNYQNDECNDTKTQTVPSLTTEMKTNISVESALCIIPPKSKWKAIQEIREHYDPMYERWPPHINLLFPFINEKYSQQIAKYISFMIKQNNIKSFDIHLNSFQVFDGIKTVQRNDSNPWNQNKIETLFLKPQGCYQELQKIFDLLKKDWSKCTAKHNKFGPHLTMGKFKVKEINRFKSKFQMSWKPISFQCDAIYLMTRQGSEPFKIRHKIPLSF